jgi:RNA polymerase sigma-70 factor (ECF subfamily)
LKESSITSILSEYHIEASIASIHAMAKDFESTDWDELVHLYEVLGDLKPGNFVSFNKAIAIGYAHSMQEGISELKKIKGLEENQYYHTAMGNFYLNLNDRSLARHSFEMAKAFTRSAQEMDLLNQKIESCKTT